MTFSPALVSEEHPLDLHDQIPAAVLALNEPNARAEQPVDVELTVQKDGSDFIVHGWARTTLLLRCARDAEMFPQPIRATIEHVLEGPHPPVIDLTPLVREDILLEIPLNPVCQLKAGDRCPVTNEVYVPRPESSEAIVGEEVWSELNKLKPPKPAKPRSTKPKPKREK